MDLVKSLAIFNHDVEPPIILLISGRLILTTHQIERIECSTTCHKPSPILEVL